VSLTALLAAGQGGQWIPLSDQAGNSAGEILLIAMPVSAQGAASPPPAAVTPGPGQSQLVTLPPGPTPGAPVAPSAESDHQNARTLRGVAQGVVAAQRFAYRPPAAEVATAAPPPSGPVPDPLVSRQEPAQPSR